MCSIPPLPCFVNTTSTIVCYTLSYTTLFRSNRIENVQPLRSEKEIDEIILGLRIGGGAYRKREELAKRDILLFLFGINTDRKSTRLNSSHVAISYDVFSVIKEITAYNKYTIR